MSIDGIEREAAALKTLVLSHLNSIKFRQMFWSLSGEGDTEELVCIHALQMLRRLEPEERESCCRNLLSVLDDNEQRFQLDHLISAIFLAAFNADLIPLLTTCELLISSTDFSLATPIDRCKFIFIRDRLHLLDYKGVRNILKLLVLDKMQSIPMALVEDERSQLDTVEQLVLTMLDRRSNLLPALFVITELHRVCVTTTTAYRAFTMPRIAAKFAEMFHSFRPLADMVSMIARPWLYPIAAHCAFGSSSGAWRLDAQTTKLHQRTHVPYRSEYLDPQSALIYHLLRQPRGREAVQQVMRSSSSSSSSGGTQQRWQCDELLQLMILEAMAAAESAPSTLKDPAVQYQWMSITMTVVFSLMHGNASFSRLLHYLTIGLQSTAYRRARGELMWLLLQYVASAISKVGVSPEDVQAVWALYERLFTDEQSLSVADSDSQRLVRMLAPACLWMHFNQRCSPEIVPKPSDSLMTQIKFLQSAIDQAEPQQDAMLAVLANAYSSNMESLQKAVLVPIQHRLDGGDELWTLPMGRVAGSHLKSLSLATLDAMTYHAKCLVFGVSLIPLTQLLKPSPPGHPPPGRLPSPATLDTVTRIISTLDYEYGFKQFIVSFSKAVQMVAQLPINQMRDFLFLLCEMFNYRLAGGNLPCSMRLHLLLTVHNAMGLPGFQQNVQLYWALEQALVRLWLWLSPSDSVALAIQLVGKQPSGKLLVLLNPSAFMGQDPLGSLNCNSEIIRVFLLNLMRSIRVTGADLSSDLAARIAQNFRWPSCSLKYFPQQMQMQTPTIENGNETVTQILVDQVEQDYMTVQELGNETRIMDYFSRPGHSPTLFCVIYRSILDGRSPEALGYYRILEAYGGKEASWHLGALVDFLLHYLKSVYDEQAYLAVSFFVFVFYVEQAYLASVMMISEMIWQLQLFPFERFLMAMVLRMTSDNQALSALIFLHTLIIHSPELNDRISALCTQLPHQRLTAHNGDVFIKLAEFYKQYPEMTWAEKGKMAGPESHLPIYYGNVAERILPAVDILLQRALELHVDDQAIQVFDLFLSTFAPCYRFHPQPLNYLYTTLFYLETADLPRDPRIQKLALAINQALEQDRTSRNFLFTPGFLSDRHNRTPPSEFCQQLIDRIIAACEFSQHPPDFVDKEWRTAELSPAGQALFSACIELMVSPHPASDTATVLLQLLLDRQLTRPCSTLNAVTMLLAALPATFHQAIYNEIERMVDWLGTSEEPDMVFGNFEHETLLLDDRRVMRVLALGQAFWQHATVATLVFLPEFVHSRLLGRVGNESQLLFVLRLVVPLLPRFNEPRERTKQIMDLAIDVYHMLGQVAERSPELRYEHTICDLLYHLKYMYVGDFVKNDADVIIQRLPLSMQEKLRFITHQPVDAIHAAAAATTTT